MELTELKDKIIESFYGSSDELCRILTEIEHDKSIYPFNEYEHVICQLINAGGLTFNQYIDIRTEYINRNPNLWIFEISAPRSFGEGFAQTYVQAKCPQLQKPSKKLDSQYTGQYDFWLDGIAIEVKASRVVDSDSDKPLYMKALSKNSDKNLLMNFQQLKPQCCDVFIWVAVFRDEIVLWIIGSKDVASNKYYSTGQHRGNHGNEGQLHINQNNIREFDCYVLGRNEDMEKAIHAAALRNKKLTP